MPMRLRTCVIGHYYSGNRCPRCQRSGSSRPELDSYRWKKLRRLVRARDGNRCRNCGATENYLFTTSFGMGPMYRRTC
jgi:hypothetical protein